MEIEQKIPKSETLSDKTIQKLKENFYFVDCKKCEIKPSKNNTKCIYGDDRRDIRDIDGLEPLFFGKNLKKDKQGKQFCIFLSQEDFENSKEDAKKEIEKLTEERKEKIKEMKKLKKDRVSVYGDRLAQASMIRLGITGTEVIEYNQYGSKRAGLYVDSKEWKKIEKDMRPKIELTEEEKIEKWAKRLSKLANISLEEAKKIAEEKLEYKEEKIMEVQSRNTESAYRLVKKMERENPLRRIKDENHARAIISASIRHNETNYEELLDEGRELASIGEIGRAEVRDYARRNFR